MISKREIKGGILVFGGKRSDREGRQGTAGTMIVIVVNITPKPTAGFGTKRNIDAANHGRILVHHE